MATLTQTGRTTNSVTVTCSGLDPAHRFTRYFHWELYQNGVMKASYDDSLPPDSSAHAKSFSGLQADTAYVVYCKIYDDAEHTVLLAFLSCNARTAQPNGAFIYVSVSWVHAQPYIYDGSTWVPATAHIYDSGWQP